MKAHANKSLWRLFDHQNNGDISDVTFFSTLKKHGILDGDPRLRPIREGLVELEVNGDGIRKISAQRLSHIIQSNKFLERLLLGGNVIPDFHSFKKEMALIYTLIKENTTGNVANYIPQLSKIDPDLLGVAICTVDGQIIKIGDADQKFTIQSASKPISYAIALEQCGDVKVHSHVGREPSGHRFNELTLNESGLPHNPMINAGAIMCCSMVGPDQHISERYEGYLDTWQELIGGTRPSFNNSVYLSEKSTADRNYALAYFMREKQAFPAGVNMHEALDFYLQCCCTEITTLQLAKVAATFANSGTNPFSNRRIFQAETVKNALSLMSSCGMYDSSGEFSFHVGLPAKSGVSGVVWLVVPNVMGIAIYSPRLDKNGNSVRGIAFAQELVKRFNFHNYDSLLFELEEKVDPRRKRYQTKVNEVMSLIFAASCGDLAEVKRLHAMGVDLNEGDYDRRTALHLAVAEKQIHVIKYLRDQAVDVQVEDRWGATPLSQALDGNDQQIIHLLSDKEPRLLSAS